MIHAYQLLKQHTNIVLDSSDFNTIAQYNPAGVTTNPSLILKSIRQTEYLHFLQTTLQTIKLNTPQDLLNHVLIDFGYQIAKQIDGYVSLELDPHLAFDVSKSLDQALELFRLSKIRGFADQVLIKIPTTWEGVQVAKALKRRGIKANMTLLFSTVQTHLCGQAEIFVVSPFVGRTTDFYKRKHASMPQRTYLVDPGLNLIHNIKHILGQYHNTTKVMAASFRTMQQVIDVMHCDYVTISPQLLDQLQTTQASMFKQSVVSFDNSKHHKYVAPVDRSRFYVLLKQNQAALLLLAQGLQQFCIDTNSLLHQIHKLRCHS